MINYVKNYCWEDICHVVSPKGYAGFIDSNHPGKIVAANWFTVFDSLV